MYDKLIPAIKKAGIETIEDPWVLTPEEEVLEVQGMPAGEARRNAWEKLNRRIGQRNADAIRRSDSMIAVLDGVDVDSGTASEIGFAFGLGHRILGYRGDFRLAGDNEGAIVNLQVEHFIYESGGTIETSLDGLITSILSTTNN